MKKIIALVIVCAFIGCDSDSGETFDVAALRQTIIENHQTPAHAALVTESGILNESIINLSNELTLTNLTIAKEAWLTSAKAYSKTEIFNIGDVENSYIHFGIYGWGALINSIETTISDDESLEGFDLNTLPTNSRGFTAIEYLLFNQSDEETLMALEDENRMTYLLLLGENLSDKIGTLVGLWEVQETTFIEFSGSGLGEGINQLVNAINNTLAVIRKSKVGTPAGLESSAVDIEELQADISGNSLELIASNLEIIEEVYFSGDLNLNEYVSSIAGNTEISDAFSESFEKINGLITEIDESLATAITEQPSEVEALHEELNVLIRLFTADVSSILSLTVTPTDADGD